MTKHYVTATRTHTAVFEIEAPSNGHWTSLAKNIDQAKIAWNEFYVVSYRESTEEEIEDARVINVIKEKVNEH